MDGDFDTTDLISFVTTEHFKLRRKGTTDDWMPIEDVRKLFPADPISGDFIDFARLRQGELLSLVADFSVATAADNAMFNVVSKCSYMNSIDMLSATAEVERLKSNFMAEGKSNDEWLFHEKNFWLLDAQRFFVANSFQFVLKSIGIFQQESDIRDLAFHIIASQLHTIHDNIAYGTLLLTPILHAPHAFTLRISRFDFSFAKIIEHTLFTHLRFVASHITHPHNIFFEIILHFHPQQLEQDNNDDTFISIILSHIYTLF